MSRDSSYLPTYAELVSAGGEYMDFIKLEGLKTEGLIKGVKLHKTEEQVFLVEFVDGSKLLIVASNVMVV